MYSAPSPLLIPPGGTMPRRTYPEPLATELFRPLDRNGPALVRSVMRPVVPQDPLSVTFPRPQAADSIRFDVTEVASESIPAAILSRAVTGALDEGGALGYGPLDGMPSVQAVLMEYPHRRGVAMDGA